MITMLKSKLHRATVTEADLNYEGSITVDENLLEAANILVYEQVDVLNINNGARFTTYTIPGKRGSGQICVNGAAARLVQKGDLVIICTYKHMDEEKASSHKPEIVLLDENNKVKIDGRIAA
jgi:aspartate 1-decarboxylase